VENDTDLPRLVGDRVAKRRASLQLSLDELAGRTGVSRAMISRIERGEVHASAVVLDRLCAGLGISLSSLFARDATSPLLRHLDRPVWQDPHSGYIRREVAPADTGSPVRIVEVEFPAGAEVHFERSRYRIIDQHVWVLEGEIEIGFANFSWRLGQGDCLHMRLVDSNWFRNTSGKAARYAVILSLEAIA
jgi:transcriptional regulator with XRE-family HTH domain